MSAPDIYVLIARDRGAPDGWTVRKWERKGTAPHIVTIVEGGVEGGVFKSGLRKGKRNYALDTHVAEMVITRADVEARQARYEAETGLCCHCGGGAKAWIGFDETGSKYEPCRRCKATGKAAP